MDKREIRQMMELLQIEDVTTKRQLKNGTVQWKLPIKYYNNFIEVASFKSGYVRIQNCGYTAYQLNKRCEGKPEYFQLNNGDYRRFSTRSCILIPNELDRLEYLIKYCVKNYYVKHANFVANGDYIPKWRYDNELHKLNCGKVRDLENKLDTIQRISRYGETE